ncbi:MULTISPECIES: HNH endonuclease [unclassified Nitratiruptor]|uniref:HNH endonuclease n=1 Tax=unclassified Nitratiruptor TaxID=2624044 RepID=UPI0018ECACBC|nr:MULTISPECIES: hypothetical protein [unclassified Nitratiruptor]
MLKPSVTYGKAKQYFLQKGLYDYWISYARRVTRNKFVKDYLYKRDNGVCPYCNKKVDIDEAVVHHKDYMNVCIYHKDDYVLIDNPTSKRPSRKAKISKCHLCKQENQEKFLDCMNRLTLIHQICNKRISME